MCCNDGLEFFGWPTRPLPLIHCCRPSFSCLCLDEFVVVISVEWWIRFRFFADSSLVFTSRQAFYARNQR